MSGDKGGAGEAVGEFDEGFAGREGGVDGARGDAQWDGVEGAENLVIHIYCGGVGFVGARLV